MNECMYEWMNISKGSRKSTIFIKSTAGVYVDIERRYMHLKCSERHLE